MMMPLNSLQKIWQTNGVYTYKSSCMRWKCPVRRYLLNTRRVDASARISVSSEDERQAELEDAQVAERLKQAARPGKIMVLEKEKDAALETANVCSKRSRRLLVRVQQLQQYAKERMLAGDEAAARNTLKTKLQVQAILDKTITRAQNNYRLASKLQYFIGFLQQEIADQDVSLGTYDDGTEQLMGPQLHPEAASALGSASPDYAWTSSSYSRLQMGQEKVAQADIRLASALSGEPSTTQQQHMAEQEEAELSAVPKQLPAGEPSATLVFNEYSSDVKHASQGHVRLRNLVDAISRGEKDPESLDPIIVVLRERLNTARRRGL